MEWSEKLQIIIDYVENHLQRQQEPIDPQEIHFLYKGIPAIAVMRKD